MSISLWSPLFYYFLLGIACSIDHVFKKSDKRKIKPLNRILDYMRKSFHHRLHSNSIRFDSFEVEHCILYVVALDGAAVPVKEVRFVIVVSFMSQRHIRN